jgi:hypothetical protein
MFSAAPIIPLNLMVVSSALSMLSFAIAKSSCYRSIRPAMPPGITGLSLSAAGTAGLSPLVAAAARELLEVLFPVKVSILELALVESFVLPETVAAAIAWQSGDLSRIVLPSTWVNFRLESMTKMASTVATLQELRPCQLQVSAARDALVDASRFMPPSSSARVRSRSPMKPRSSDGIVEKFRLNADAIAALHELSPSERARILLALDSHRRIRHPSNWVVNACLRSMKR